MNKRRFLAILGGGVVVAATASIAMAFTDKGRASAPWRDADATDADPRRRALSYALLAPSAHNLQPWLVDLSAENEITLYVDRQRLLRKADPFDRQTTIGLGCFLELLAMATAADGYRAEVHMFPEGADAAALDGRPVARMKLVNDVAAMSDPLFQKVLDRRSNKEPYDLDRSVPAAALTALQIAMQGVTVGATSNPDQIADLRALTAAAIDVELHTPAYAESVGHYRMGKAEIEASPDGIGFSGLFFEALILFGQFSREAALDPTSGVFASGRKMMLAQANTAMGHVWLVTAGNTRDDQIRAGRAWVRVNLAATGAGLAVHPLSQALEEMPEMAETRAAAHALLAPQGGTLQMLARLGYAAPSGPSPRWPLDSKIVRKEA